MGALAWAAGGARGGVMAYMSRRMAIECVYSVCFLIVIGEAAARGERAEGSVATGTPFCRSGLLRSGSAGYCARADMAASESSSRPMGAAETAVRGASRCCDQVRL